MKAIYLETFAGISGNMLLGALLDAGFPIDVLKSELANAENLSSCCFHAQVYGLVLFAHFLRGT